MNVATNDLTSGIIAKWFPLVPRPRPRCEALISRISEVHDLTQQASRQNNNPRLVSAAEALNKAALILSDCGLHNQAAELCWRQFNAFASRTPLNAETAKLALQPVVNLGRLAIRNGHGDRAYKIFKNAFHAASEGTSTTIDDRDIDIGAITDTQEDRGVTRRFLWTVLLTDGTRALTRAARWADAYDHIQRHKGIGTRLLDGRQVAALAHSAAADHHRAITIVDQSSLTEPWERTLAALLKALFVTRAREHHDTAIHEALAQYLALKPSPGHPVFDIRLGLTATTLADGAPPAQCEATRDQIMNAAHTSGDAYTAHDILNHALWALAQDERAALSNIVASSGLLQGDLPRGQADALDAAVHHALQQLAPDGP